MPNTLAPAPRRVPATAPQLSFINALLRDRDVPAATREALPANLSDLSKAAASNLITALKAAPYARREPVPAPVAVAAVADVPAAPAFTPEKGDVLLSPAANLIIRVRASQQGNLYALTRPASASPADGPLPAFSYAPGLLRNLPADARRLTLSEATAISAAWGECFRCGRTLTDPASVAKGIGPVCITYVQP
jgi:hypothetical protein